MLNLFLFFSVINRKVAETCSHFVLVLCACFPRKRSKNVDKSLAVRIPGISFPKITAAVDLRKGPFYEYHYVHTQLIYITHLNTIYTFKHNITHF